MSNALDLIYAKIDRADEHLRTLDSEIRRFENAEPLRVAFKVDLKTGWNTAYFVGGPPAPPILSILLGEALYQSRSALEHLVWALVRANKHKPGRQHAFPIHTTPVGTRGMTRSDAFVRAMKASDLAGVRIAAIKIIERLQPYNRRNPADHPLAILHKLAIHDRHRAFATWHVSGSPGALQRIFVPHRGARIVEFRTTLRDGQSIAVRRKKIARMRILPLAREPKVDLKGTLPTRVAFGDGTFRLDVPLLEKLNGDVRKLLGLFEKFL